MRGCWYVLPLLLANLPGGAMGAAEVVIKRDVWGVPHIFAPTLADAAYGLGYAQAEDRLEQIMVNYRLAIGRMAEVAGPDYVEHDWLQRLCGHEEVCRRRWPEVPADVRAMCESFQAGVRAYMAAQPGREPAARIEMEPWMIPALGRMIVFGWPIGQAFEELQRRGEVQFYSNQWAVRPERTADGAALLLIDPHIPWDGPFRFYEFRMHVPGLDVSGFAPVGAPVVGLGHNNYLGWACTTGGPDTTDIYVEQLDPDNPQRYRYDEEWREIRSEPVTIAVKGAEPVVRQLERSHHGPIVKREDGKAYAVACPYFEEIGLIEQLYRMMTATDLESFNAAADMRQLMEQNLMMADVAGNIQYIRTGRVPIRPPGFDFSKPVPGNTSRSEWLGIHPTADLVVVRNPPTGYLQNCNIGPDTMAAGLNLDPAAYPSYIYFDQPGRTNSRGRRAVELLEAHPKLTIAQAMAIVLDDHADGGEAWQAAVRRAASSVNLPATFGEDAPLLRQAIRHLSAWNGHMHQDSVAATIYRMFRQAASEQGVKVEVSAFGLDAQRHLLGALALACLRLVEAHGTIEVPYGRIHRVQRGERSWPASGGESGGGMTLRAISANLRDGVFYGRAGQNWVQLVQFKRGAVRSWSLTPYGQSDDPESPHYCDQAERLFSPGKLKPTWFDPNELEGHVESVTTLTR